MPHDVVWNVKKTGDTMGKRPRMTNRYRRFSFLSDIEGMKNAIGEMKGMFFPKQPELNTDAFRSETRFKPDDRWFTDTLTDKIAHHPENAMEYPFTGEPIFEKPLVGFVRGDDPLFDKYKDIIGPHHFTPYDIMKWQAEIGRAHV
jgi:hypothetical protein